MSSFQRLRAWAQPIVNVGVLACIGGLAIWGHLHHWRIPGLSAHAASGPTPELGAEPSKVRAIAVGEAFRVVEFDSVEVVQQAGIESSPGQSVPLDITVQANAAVTYDQTRIAQLSSRVPGQVWRVLARLGQSVHRGDVLAVIDAPEVGQAKADFVLEFATSGYRSRTLDRLRTVAREGAISDRALREAEATAWEARNRYLTAFQRLINLGFELDLAKLEATAPEQLQRHLQLLGLPETLTKQLDASVRSANLIPLLAPFDGVITHLDLVIGERISPERSGLTMADVRTMWLRLSVRKEDAARLAAGQPVRFAADSVASHVAEGKLDWISTEVDEKTRTVQALARVENPCMAAGAEPTSDCTRLLRANEYGSATIRVGHVEDAVMVPRKAVQRFDDQPIVFIVRPDQKSFQARRVTLGDAKADLLQIRTGIRAGENVVTTHSHVLKSELVRAALAEQ